MGKFHLSILVMALCLLTPALRAEPAKLTKADRELLDSLFKDLLFDPKGAEMVLVELHSGTVWRKFDNQLMWLVKGKEGKPDKVFTADGLDYPLSKIKKITPINFVEQVKKFFKLKPPLEGDVKEWINLNFKKSLGLSESATRYLNSTWSYLLWSAFLYGLKEEELSAKVFDFSHLFDRVDTVESLRESLRTDRNLEIYDSFSAADDEFALACCTHYLRKFSEKDEKLPSNVKELEQDLKRRIREGSFNRGKEKIPAEYHNWSFDNKIRFLWKNLENVSSEAVSVYERIEVHSLDFRILGYKPYYPDWRFKALVELGESAVPFLIKKLESDTRLSRAHTVTGVRRTPSNFFVSVDEIIRDALCSILKQKNFNMQSEILTENKPEEINKQINEYWNKYGRMTFRDRMVCILESEKLPFHLREQAIRNLTGYVEDEICIEGSHHYLEGRDWIQYHPNHERRKPTIAETILAARDQKFAAFDLNNLNSEELYTYWPAIENERYLKPLINLRDHRIAPQLAQRAAIIPELEIRLNYVKAAHQLGSSGEWYRLLREVERGVLPLELVDPKTAFQRTSEEEMLSRIIDAMITFKSPESERVLEALTDRNHPYYALLHRSILKEKKHVFLTHPIGLRILMRELKNKEPTGHICRYRDDQLVIRHNHILNPIDYFRLEPNTKFLVETEERFCDAAAYQLSKMVFGVPFYSRLLENSEEVLAQIVSLQRFRFKDDPALFSFFFPERLSCRELTFIDGFLASTLRNSGYLVPDIKPLGRPATKADVEHGDAIFFLQQPGKISTENIPCLITLKKKDGRNSSIEGLAVQAEIGRDGKKTYGVIFRREIRAVSEEEVLNTEAYSRSTSQSK